MLIKDSTTPENIIGFIIDGKLAEAEVEELFTEIEARANQFGKIRLYAIVKEVEGWDTLKSFFNTMRHKFKIIGKIEKYALLTDKLWLKNASKFGDFLTPGIDIRTFGLNDTGQALKWLQLPTLDDTLNIKQEDTGVDHVLGFSINGNLSKADYEFINEQFDSHLSQHPDVRVYFEILSLKGMTLNAFFQDIKTTINYYDKILKIAIVAKGMETITKIGDFFTPGISAKHFQLDQKQEAIEWLK